MDLLDVEYRYSFETFFSPTLANATRKKEQINALLVCGEHCQVERKILSSWSSRSIFSGAIKEVEEPENMVSYNGDKRRNDYENDFQMRILNEIHTTFANFFIPY